MKLPLPVFRSRAVLLLLGGWLGAVPVVPAYPPAPHHVLYGMVRDEYGTPLNLADAEVVFVTAAGARLRATGIEVGEEPGANYGMNMPLDSGVTAHRYKPTAAMPNQQFRLEVRIGQRSYLPIEMVADFSRMGQPAQRTRLDLTLGEDTDGDGLPDAWERAVASLLGGNWSLADIRPGDDLDGDGLSNRQEYLAGTFAFDPADGLSLSIAGFNQGHTALEFLGIAGRTYSIQASSGLRTWMPVQFRLASAGPQSPLLNHHAVDGTRFVRVEIPPPPGPVTNRFFRAMVQ